METNLFKVSKVCWVVTSAKDDGEPQVFENVDDAAMYLEDLGVPDEEVDAALIDMADKSTTRANFGVKNDSFIYSDNTRYHESIGIA